MLATLRFGVVNLRNVSASVSQCLTSSTVLSGWNSQLTCLSVLAQSLRLWLWLDSITCFLSGQLFSAWLMVSGVLPLTASKHFSQKFIVFHVCSSLG